MKISLFPRANATKPDSVISVDDFLNNIKYGTWKDLIEPIRTEQDKEKRKTLKEQVPAVTISGTFTSRNQNNIIKHSGFIAIDIDGFNDKSPILADIYTYSCFRSASGNGLCVLVKINPEKHKECFRWIQQHYFNTYGIIVDPAPSNVASLRFVSFDPELFINEKSKHAKILQEAKAAKSLPVIISTDKVGEHVKEVVQRGINIAEQYDDYLRCGFAIANGFGEGGREYFHAISAQSNKYNSQQADRQYDICLKGATKSGITVGTFYFFLKQAGINIENENHRAVQISTLAKRSKRTKEGVVRQLVQMEGVSEDQATKLVDDVYDRNDITLKTISADPERLIESLQEWMKQNHVIKKNVITRNIEENGEEVTKERLNTIFLRARSVFNTPHVTYDLIERLIFSEFTEKYNPIQEYIDKNRYRNSTGNIDLLIKSVRTTTVGAPVFIRKWAISIPAAAAGFPVRSVLAFCGPQNTGKSEWFRRFLPASLLKYYAESKLEAGKDDELLMCQKLIVMDDEMGGKSKSDEKRFKELTSKNIFSLRAPYGRANEDFKRLAILCGTSNTMDIINDPTGNTRILPVEVLSIDHELYNSIDKDELFMECVRAYESGEEWRLNQGELNHLHVVSDEFQSTPYERELISKFFRANDQKGYVEFMTSTDIKNHIEINTKQQIKNIKIFSIELKNLFGKSHVKKINNVSSRVFEVIRSDQHNTLQNSTLSFFDPTYGDDDPF